MALRLHSLSEQVASYLRKQLLRRRWIGPMPGILHLEEELGVNRALVEGAFRILEKEGLLIPQGRGRPRLISLPDNPPPPAVRVGLLLYEQEDRRRGLIIDLQHQLVETGHAVQFARRTISGLGARRAALARLVERAAVDCWIVVAGSQPVLEYFVDTGTPVLAMFGRRRKLPIAGVGPEKAPAYVAATRRLLALGHRRIVLLARRVRRLPEPGNSELAFLAELEAHGVSPSSYHLPDWDENAEGFLERLDALLRHTPPTALMIDEAPQFHAARHHLARRGILAPDNISLICTDPDPTFLWCRPTIAHIHWETSPVVRRIVGWVNNVARGKNDRRATSTKATFIAGGTIGPAMKGRA